MTMQIAEILIDSGEEKSLHPWPEIPTDRDWVHFGPGSSNPVLRSTACWRGYQGKWEIREDRLHLCSLEGRYSMSGPPKHADWVTGVFQIQSKTGYVRITLRNGCVTERGPEVPRGEDLLPGFFPPDEA
jgi:hypothetical protein